MATRKEVEQARQKVLAKKAQEEDDFEIDEGEELEEELESETEFEEEEEEEDDFEEEEEIDMTVEDPPIVPRIKKEEPPKKIGRPGREEMPTKFKNPVSITLHLQTDEIAIIMGLIKGLRNAEGTKE